MPIMINLPSHTQDGIDTSDATATSADMKKGVTAYVDGVKITGSAYTLGSEYTFVPDTTNHYLVSGFYNGISLAGDADLVAENIKNGVTIFNVEGTYEGLNTSDATATSDDILLDKTAYVNGEKVVGTIPLLEETTYTPGIHNIGIEDNQYLLGTQTILGDKNLVAENIKSGVTIFEVEGTYSGTGEGGIDTSDATATSDDILLGKTAYVDGEKITGTIESQKEQIIVPGVIDKTISSGIYIAGTQTICGDEDLLAENIKEGVTIFGVVGTYSGETGESESSEIRILNCTNMTSTNEILNEYGGIIKTLNTSTSEYEDLEAYSYNLTQISAYYSSSYASSTTTGAGFNINKVGANAAMYGTMTLSIKKTSALLKMLYYVSSWINPSIQFSLVSATSTEEIENKISSEDFAYSTTLTLANANNNSYTYNELDDIPLGTYYPVLIVPSNIQGNEALIKYMSLYFL